MLEPKKLLVLQDINGYPMPLRDDQPLDLGSFDVENGASLTFALRNENITPALIADITKLHTDANNSSFHGPKEVQPGETVQCSIKILSDDTITLESFNADELPSSSDRLTGKVKWKRT